MKVHLIQLLNGLAKWFASSVCEVSGNVATTHENFPGLYTSCDPHHL